MFASSCEKLLFFGCLVLVRSVLCDGFAEEFSSGSYDLGSVIMELLDGLRRNVESVVGTHVIELCVENAVLYLDSVFGPENIYSFAMFVEMLLKFVAEGAASGLNVIAVYVSEILRATGVNETISIPHFTADGVSTVTKCALLALLGYWLLSVLLRVIVALVRRVFWLIKAVAVLWLFARIVLDPVASTEVTTMRLTLLVFTCAVFESPQAAEEATWRAGSALWRVKSKGWKRRKESEEQLKTNTRGRHSECFM